MSSFEASIRYKTDFIFNYAKKLVDIIIVELDEFKIFIHIHYGQKIGRNCSKLGSSFQILIDCESYFSV